MTILLPYCSHTSILWRALAVEPSLTARVLELLLQKMSRDVPFKESRAFLLSSCPGRVATPLPLAVSAGPGPPPRPFSLFPTGRDPTGGLALPCRHLAAGWALQPSLIKASQVSVPKGDYSVSSCGKKINLARRRFQQSSSCASPSSSLLRHPEQAVGPVPRQPRGPVPASCPRGPSWAWLSPIGSPGSPGTKT